MSLWVMLLIILIIIGMCCIFLMSVFMSVTITFVRMVRSMYKALTS